MVGHVYKVVEIVGSSGDSIEDAVRSGVARAAQTLDNLDWFEVVETRGHIENGKLGHFQVVMKLGFQLRE